MIHTPRLCYIDPVRSIAFFTDKPLTGPDRVWGDDWDDAPYEHNSGLPYAWTVMVFFVGNDADTPDRGHINSPYSVENINNGAVPWLMAAPWRPEPDFLDAGATVPEFFDFIYRLGGSAIGLTKDGNPVWFPKQVVRKGDTE